MFDPYHKWLAIPRTQRPPTYYHLLGVAFSEDDPEVIAEAAIRQTSHVRTYQTGTHAQECTRLLNEIAQARSTLLNPEKRRRYDAGLGRAALEKVRAQPAALGNSVPGVADAPLRFEPSVAGIANLLIRSRLLSAEEVQHLQQRWQQEANDDSNLDRFAKWLVANQYVTEYQAAMLLHGHAEHFFLGHYKLLDCIGRGRMGIVFRAVHRLGQVVAIKTLLPSRTRDRQLRARFRREARLARRLQHPHVVRTFQFGDSDGMQFMVMEHLEGETLQDVLNRRGRLPPVEAVRLVYQALLGLQHLHEQGLVHRNLEPANLMLVPGMKPGQPDTTLNAAVKILDISLSRAPAGLPASESAEALALSYEGGLLGTSDYQAPEQARNAHDVDIRADIYSLGCILYHALAGQPPFADISSMRQMIRHATEAPRPLAEFSPEVPDGLQLIVNWMTAKDPAQRYPTPERAAQALQTYLLSEAEPVSDTTTRQVLPTYLEWLEADQRNEAEVDEPAPELDEAAADEFIFSSLSSDGTPPPGRGLNRKAGKIAGLRLRDYVMIVIGAGTVLAAHGVLRLITRP